MLGLVEFLSSVVIVMLATMLYFRFKLNRLLKFSEKIPGPKKLPIIGNVLDMGFNPEALLDVTSKLINQYPPVLRIWLGPMLLIAVTEPKHIEVVMRSYEHIRKAFVYKHLTPWLGTGLLTSFGQKWKSHRKMLTPSFHFQILGQFTEVFNRNGDILVLRLSRHADGPQFDITDYIVMCTLDVICESTMGVSVNAQMEGSADYVRSIRRMGNVAIERSLKPWLYNDTTFALSTLKRVQNECLAVLHNKTNSVIRIRRQELLAECGKQTVEQSEDDEIGTKRHANFLDLMLQPSKDGNCMTEEEIREEVDTFMFEGHDTTASCCLFTLWALAKHQDVQDKVLGELRDIFGDSDRETTFSDLNEMSYLENVIKETMRLYPSVPMFGRELTKDVQVDDYVFPAGAQVVFVPQCTHRKPEYFPDPEKFDPDRFLPENCVGRHPYSYIPFAAGPRNCIGQKFAVLELKSLLSKMVRSYRICLGDPEEKLKLVGELVLKSKNGIKLKLLHRK